MISASSPTTGVFPGRQRVGWPWLGLLALALALLVSPSAAAKGKQPSEIDKDAARTLVQQGDERTAVRDYKRALKAYEGADEIMGVPTTALLVAKTYVAMRKLVEARDAYRRAADFPKKPGEPTPFTRGREEGKDRAKEIARLLPKLTISVEGAESGTDITVSIDAEEEEAWARAVPVNPGHHVVEASARGYRSTREEIVLEEGEKRTMVLHLAAQEGFDPGPDLGEPDDGEPADLWPVVYAGFGVAAVGVMVGAITGAISLDAAAQAKDYCEGDACTPEAEEPLNESRTLAHVSTAGFVIGGLGAAAGATALILTLLEDGEASDRDGDATEPEDDEGEVDEDDVDMEVDLGLGWIGLRGTF
ncbi:MAG: hypothetical protein JRI68_25010 [Deltaproteobacteria bacterium]|nr:hypothetical protein [Deltaproteobacteria bacterium]